MAGFIISKEFPSRFVTGFDISGKAVPLVISKVMREEAFSPKNQKKEPVLVVYFEGKERGVRLGKQRARELRDITGSDNTDDWKGKTVVMYTEKKNAFGADRDIIHFKAKE